MRKVEDYWQDFMNFGFIKNEKQGRTDYTLPEGLGRGGFSILGNPQKAMGIISDCTIYKPLVVIECVHEKMIELGQYYYGSVDIYQKKSEARSFEYGLNAYVNHPFFYGYKKIEENIPLVNVGFAYREEFFENLPIELPDDFWDRAAAALNSDILNIPKVSYICNQLRECSLSGNVLNIYIEGKALEVFAIIFDYIYRCPKNSSLYLSEQDKDTLSLIKDYIKSNYNKNMTISELTRYFAINQQKIVTGFKETYHMTLNEYRRKLRMSRALELLSTTDLPIVEIAREVGYYGDGFFQKAFKKVYNVTPHSIRKNLKS